MKKINLLCIIITILSLFLVVPVFADESDNIPEPTGEKVIVEPEMIPPIEEVPIPAPIEDIVNNQFFVKFVDENENKLTTGKYTDNKTCSNYFTKGEIYDGHDMSIYAMACAIKLDLNYYDMSYVYPICYQVDVQVNEVDNTWKKFTTCYDSIEEGVIFNEVETPTGYLPLEGSIIIQGNADCTDIHIVEDATNRAYIRDNTLYIVYEKDPDYVTDKIELPEQDKFDTANTLYVKFIDTDSNAIKTGKFTDNFNDSLYYTITKSYYTDPSKEPISTTIFPKTNENEVLNLYNMEDGYMMHYTCNVNRTEDEYSYTELVMLQSITLEEIETPIGYKALEGPIDIYISQDASTLFIKNDPTNRAYIDGDTLYIVYEKEQNESTEDTSTEESTTEEELTSEESSTEESIEENTTNEPTTEESTTESAIEETTIEDSSEDNKEQFITIIYKDGTSNQEIFKDIIFENILVGDNTPVPDNPNRQDYQFAGWIKPVAKFVSMDDVNYIDENNNNCIIYSASWELIQVDTVAHATPVVQSNTTNTENGVEVTAAKTGDSNDIMVYLAIASLSIITMIIIVYYKRHYNRSNY